MTGELYRRANEPTELELRLEQVEQRLDAISPTAPCGQISRRLPMTVGAQIALAAHGSRSTSRAQKQTWRRVCGAPLGHAGEWHRSEDGQVWHDSDCRTLEQIRAEDDERARERAAIVDALPDTDT